MDVGDRTSAVNGSAYKVSVVLCVHNPDRRVFHRVIMSLAGQSITPDNWELLVVDNASSPPVSRWLEGISEIDRVQLRIIHEPRLGLTSARVAGIEAAKASVLLFVDDDTLLDSNYIEQLMKVMDEHSEIGAAGGRIRGEFESPVKPWMSAHLGNLAIRDFGDRPIRSLIYNEGGPWEPCGAGMVVRREVAQAYIALLSDERRKRLDRTGAKLSSCGDTDMVRTATELGYYLAYEPTLGLTHVIPKERLGMRYLTRISYSIQRDAWVLYRLRGKQCGLSYGKYMLKLLTMPLRTLTTSPGRWMLTMAEELGRLRGRRISLDG